MKTRYLMVLLSSGVIVLLIAITYLWETPKPASFKCHSVLIHSRYFDKPDYMSILSLSINLSNSTMNVSVSGRLSKDNKVYIILRSNDYTVKSSARLPGMLNLTSTQTTISQSDTLPDEYLNDFFPFARLGSKRWVKLNRLQDGDILFTTHLGPFFICNV